jgi:type IV secretion system protein VirB8
MDGDDRGIGRASGGQPMSETVALKAGSWTAEPLNDADREHYFRLARSRFDEFERIGKAVRRGAYIIAGLGSLVGVAGIVGGAAVFWMKENAPPNVIEVNSTTGETKWLHGEQAANGFPELTAQKYLREYIEYREGYVPDTAQRMAHRVAIMSSPTEQKLYADWFDYHNPRSPQTVYGRKGGVRVDNFHFIKQETGRNKTQIYLVTFDRTEINDGVPDKAKHWTASVQFQWHPELRMEDQDRQINAAGFQAIAYRAYAQ